VLRTETQWWWRIKKDASQWRGIKKMNSVLVMEIEGDEQQYFIDGNYRFAQFCVKYL
jgi:hypothetical protein